MARPITMFTGQWADVPCEELVPKFKEMGFDGMELCCWGDHFDVSAALNDPGYCDAKHAQLDKYGLKCWALSNHLRGQCVLDIIDERHKSFLPADVWGDGDPAGVNARAAEEMKKTARAAQKFGVSIVNGFTGSSIWQYIYSFPPVTADMIKAGYDLLAERWLPILDVYQECGVKFALEVHPTEIAFDLYSAEATLKALNYHPAFGFNFDPSHLIWQGVDPVEFIREFPDRIFHCHVKDAIVKLNGKTGILGSHLDFGDYRRGWEFRSVGRGEVNFEEITRALNDIGYTGPLSVEWEDSNMEREQGAMESCEFIRNNMQFSKSDIAFDSNFDKQ